MEQETKDEATALPSRHRDDPMQKWIAASVLFAWIGLNYLLFTQPLPEGSTELVSRVLGTLDAAVMAILYYHYGTSRSSAIKNEWRGGAK